jgi:hypothetical protein
MVPVKVGANVELVKGQIEEHVAVVEQMFADAVVRGVATGVAKELNGFAIPVSASVPAATRASNKPAKQAKPAKLPKRSKAAPQGGSATAEAQPLGTSTKALHRASPRQRGSLERDARTVFDFIKKNPGAMNQDIASATGFDPKLVSESLKYLRGYNVRGEPVRNPVIELPEGDRRRYTKYAVIKGASFPEVSTTASSSRKKASESPLLSDPPPSSPAPVSTRAAVGTTAVAPPGDVEEGLDLNKLFVEPEENHEADEAAE